MFEGESFARNGHGLFECMRVKIAIRGDQGRFDESTGFTAIASNVTDSSGVASR
jgi:hypothetical protein